MTLLMKDMQSLILAFFFGNTHTHTHTRYMQIASSKFTDGEMYSLDPTGCNNVGVKAARRHKPTLKVEESVIQRPGWVYYRHTVLHKHTLSYEHTHTHTHTSEDKFVFIAWYHNKDKEKPL